MRTELQSLVKNGKPEMYYHWNTQRATQYAAKADSSSDESEKLRFSYLYWTELVNSGQTTRCIQEINNYLSLQGDSTEIEITRGNKPIFDLLAVAYLRLGEQENCIANHTANSCIIPFKNNALHQLTSGSENAIKIYNRIIDKFPGDSQSKWLYNVAHMTLGHDLEELQEDRKINYPNWDLEQIDFPLFNNISMPTGVDIDGLSGGTCIDDFNGDGYLDIFATSYGMEDQVRLMINDRKGKFIDRTSSAGLTGIVSGLNAIHADYDNDGYRDIFVLRGAWLGKYGTHPNSLLKNLGNGQFEDVTFASGLGSRFPTQTAAWSDYNRDGNLDLFIGNESENGFIAYCELYENNGDGTFREVSGSVGIRKLGIIKGVAWGDINNDMWPDLYVSCLGCPNSLYKNIQGHFIEITDSASVADPEFGFPCWFWDYDQDGWQDILAASYDMDYYTRVSEAYFNEIKSGELIDNMLHLYRNNGDETFTDVSEETDLSKVMHTMGSNYGDLDNDGFPDFYIGTGAPNLQSIVPNRMFHNIHGNYFDEVTSAGGFGHLQKGHAVAFGDLDNDGDQDIYVVLGGAFDGDNFTNALFENPGSENHWISIDLAGVQSNRDGIGSKITIETISGNSAKKLNFYASSGGSFGSSSLRQEMGLGRIDSIKSIIIDWPSGMTQVFRNVAPNQFYKIVEDLDTMTVPDLQGFQFSDQMTVHTHN